MQLTSTCWIRDDRRPEASPQRKPTGTLFHRKRDALNSPAFINDIVGNSAGPSKKTRKS